MNWGNRILLLIVLWFLMHQESVSGWWILAFLFAALFFDALQEGYEEQNRKDSVNKTKPSEN